VKRALAVAICLASSLGASMAQSHVVTTAQAAGFNECAYRGAVWPQVQATADIVDAAGQMKAGAFIARQTTWGNAINRIDDRFQSYYYGPAKRLEDGLRSTWQSVADAIDARDSGDVAGQRTYLAQASSGIERSWSVVSSMCPLGRPSHLALTVGGGNAYGNGVFPVPLEPPWLGPKSFLVHWTFDCAGHPPGFRIEVRRIQAHGGRVTATGVYIGPLVMVATNETSVTGRGSTIVANRGGKLYLIVRSKCANTLQIYD
jgi:hypothetical protein